jgi:hypothetical protein
MPTIRNNLEPQPKPKSIFDVTNNEDINWAHNNVFKHRYFYDKELKLLGLYSVHRCMTDLFDGSVFFQNNCDQDYDRRDWSSIKEFEQIYDKYMNAPAKEIVEKFENGHWALDEDELNDKLDYARKTLAYDEIWDRYKDTLNDENSVIYFSVFGHYEFRHIADFILKCYDEYETKFKSWSKS